MRASLLPSPLRPLVGGTLTATVALTLAPAAGADVLVSTPDAGKTTTPPVLVAPDGTRRTLAVVPGAEDDDAPTPVVSPDRRFVAVGRTTSAFLLPTDGSAALKLDAFVGAASGGSAFWWLGPGRVASFAGGLGVPGSIATCAVPGGTCKDTRAPGGTRIGTFADGASVWLDEQDYDLPERLNRAISSWTTASAPEVRTVRAALRRRLRQRLVLRSPGGATRVLRTTRRSSVAGTDAYAGMADGGARALYGRVRVRTTLDTRRRNGRTQVRLAFRSTDVALGTFTTSGRRRSFRFRTPAGTIGTSVGDVTTVPGGGWLVSLAAKDGKGTPLVGRASPGGTVRTLALAGRPLTARALSAAIGVPVPPGVRPASGFERDLRLRPVGYEAATDSDVVTYDEPGGTRVVVARVPRSGAAPSLVFRGGPAVESSAIAW